MKHKWRSSGNYQKRGNSTGCRGRRDAQRQRCRNKTGNDKDRITASRGLRVAWYFVCTFCMKALVRRQNLELRITSHLSRQWSSCKAEKQDGRFYCCRWHCETAHLQETAVCAWRHKKQYVQIGWWLHYTVSTTFSMTLKTDQIAHKRRGAQLSLKLD